MFQLALPRRERPFETDDDFAQAKVSTRAPAKGATNAIEVVAKRNLVSTRAPAKGATRINGRAGILDVPFQLALPRRERLGEIKIPQGATEVSTRAPAKGATTEPYPII